MTVFLGLAVFFKYEKYNSKPNIIMTQRCSNFTSKQRSELFRKALSQDIISLTFSSEYLIALFKQFMQDIIYPQKGIG